VERVVLNALPTAALPPHLRLRDELDIVFGEADPPHAAFFTGCAFLPRDLVVVFFFAPVSFRLF